MSAPEEFVAFCQREHPRLVGALTLYTGDPDVAEEVAQDALLKACERWGAVSAMDRPGAWVHRVAMNAASSRFRRRGAERRARRRLEVASSHQPSEADQADDRLVVRRLVAALPERQRRAVVLRHFLGMDVEEVAVHLECRPGAVRALTHRAIASLREHVADLELESELEGVPE